MKEEETIKCRDLQEKWETKGVKLEPKTIDEILDLYGFNSDSLKANIEQLINQRVIDELKGIIYNNDLSKDSFKRINKLIKELKEKSPTH